MTEPPIRVQPDGVEAEPVRTGARWVDLVLAGSAILISVVSLIVAIANSRIQQKMVAAASWPVLFLDSGNRDDKTGGDVITLAVRNDGAGPAVLKSLAMTWRGKRYASIYPLLIDCCGWRYIETEADKKVYAMAGTRLSRSVIPPGGERVVVMVPRTDLNGAIWRRLDQARFDVGFDACYCSVLGECWNSRLDGGEPKAVRSCPEPPSVTR